MDGQDMAYDSPSANVPMQGMGPRPVPDRDATPHEVARQEERQGRRIQLEDLARQREFLQTDLLALNGRIASLEAALAADDAEAKIARA